MSHTVAPKEKRVPWTGAAGGLTGAAPWRGRSRDGRSGAGAGGVVHRLGLAAAVPSAVGPPPVAPDGEARVSSRPPEDHFPLR